MCRAVFWSEKKLHISVPIGQTATAQPGFQLHDGGHAAIDQRRAEVQVKKRIEFLFASSDPGLETPQNPRITHASATSTPCRVFEVPRLYAVARFHIVIACANGRSLIYGVYVATGRGVGQIFLSFFYSAAPSEARRIFASWARSGE